MNQPAASLGAVLHDIRKRNGWTLREMSGHCGIPVSTLSKIEHDQLTLGYDRLIELGRRLGLGIADLFAPPGPATRGGPRRSINRDGEGLRTAGMRYDSRYLFAELGGKRLVPTVIRVLARDLAEFGPLARHPGEELAYVLEGVVVVHTEGHDPVPLSAGDSIYLDGGLGHGYLLAPGCAAASILCVGTVEDALGHEGAAVAATPVPPIADGDGPDQGVPGAG
jgi:transcriptional regulator with XRE-family HTH domain